MPRTQRSALAAGLLLAVSLPLAACTAAAPAPGPDPDPTEAQPDPAPQPSADGALGLLADLPAATDDRMTISFGDVDAIAAANGTDRPVPGDVESLLAWGGIDAAVPVYPPTQLSPQRFAQHDEFAAELGFGVWDLAQFAGVDAPPAHLTAVRGDIDTSAMDAAIGAASDGIWSLGGEDFETDLSGVTVARPLGESLRLGMLGDDELMMSTATGPLRAALDGSGGSLLDDADIAAVVDALAAEGAISGLIAVDDFAIGNEQSLPEPFGAVGIGHLDGSTIVLVYATADADAAEADAAAAEELLTNGTTLRGAPYADLLDFQSAEVVGDALVVRVSAAPGAQPSVAVSMLMQREALFLAQG